MKCLIFLYIVLHDNGYETKHLSRQHKLLTVLLSFTNAFYKLTYPNKYKLTYPNKLLYPSIYSIMLLVMLSGNKMSTYVLHYIYTDL